MYKTFKVGMSYFVTPICGFHNKRSLVVVAVSLNDRNFVDVTQAATRCPDSCSALWTNVSYFTTIQISSNHALTLGLCVRMFGLCVSTYEYIRTVTTLATTSTT